MRGCVMADAQHAPQPAQDSVVSDVLASIRRLIAQDGKQLPGRPLHDQPIASESRFLLGHDDLIAPEKAPPDAVRLQLVSVNDLDDDCWQPAQIADWPGAETPAATPDLGTLHPQAEPDLTPEEEAEFAEAEAALASITASLRPPEPQPEPEPEPQLDPPALNLFAPAGDGDVALRDLIRDTIRAELQGEMGERLSGNIRLMIRAEVETVIRDICARG